MTISWCNQTWWPINLAQSYVYITVRILNLAAPAPYITYLSRRVKGSQTPFLPLHKKINSSNVTCAHNTIKSVCTFFLVGRTEDVQTFNVRLLIFLWGVFLLLHSYFNSIRNEMRWYPVLSDVKWLTYRWDKIHPVNYDNISRSRTVFWPLTIPWSWFSQRNHRTLEKTHNFVEN
jgi:hypothetical protein